MSHRLSLEYCAANAEFLGWGRRLDNVSITQATIFGCYIDSEWLEKERRNTLICFRPFRYQYFACVFWPLVSSNHVSNAAMFAGMMIDALVRFLHVATLTSTFTSDAHASHE